MFRPTLLALLSLFVLFSSNCPAVSYRQLRIGNTQFHVEVVSSPAEQQLGLGNRDRLAAGTGMLFLYKTIGERVFWMKRMKFALDILWIRSDHIVYIQESVPPPPPMLKEEALPRYGQGIHADMVLELQAGTIRQLAIQQGDTVVLLP